jgi:DNA recombination protein RmuC
MIIVYTIAGIAGGALIVWLAMKSRLASLDKDYLLKLSEAEKLRALEVNGIDKEKSILAERYNNLLADRGKLEHDLEAERNRCEGMGKQIARFEAENKNLTGMLETQKKDLEEIQKKFTTEFENIANKILKQNSLEFTTVNQKNIGDILNPLKEKIQNFEKKVEDTYQKGIKDQTDLKAELKKLYDLNSKISEEANNLTRALKSDSKKQGNWGEVILERVLERSGLVKGQEYDTQVTARSESGELIRPDVIIYLPEKKHIIIDSKVSLLAYEAYINEDDQQERENHLRQHVDSIRSHVKGLSEKNYTHADGFDTPDFVLLFMPIESAFSAAIQADVDLFNFAWEKKIVMVSPTTLLATLRTIASIWKHEKQTRNAMEIAALGGALYDKFVGFHEDLISIGVQIGKLSKTYDDAKNKLKEGRGNLISQAEKLKNMGAKTTKSIPAKFLEDYDNG